MAKHEFRQESKTMSDSTNTGPGSHTCSKALVISWPNKTCTHAWQLWSLLLKCPLKLVRTTYTTNSNAVAGSYTASAYGEWQYASAIRLSMNTTGGGHVGVTVQSGSSLGRVLGKNSHHYKNCALSLAALLWISQWDNMLLRLLSGPEQLYQAAEFAAGIVCTQRGGGIYTLLWVTGRLISTIALSFQVKLLALHFYHICMWLCAKRCANGGSDFWLSIKSVSNTLSCCCFVCAFIIGQYHSGNNMSSTSGAAGEILFFESEKRHEIRPLKTDMLTVSAFDAFIHVHDESKHYLSHQFAQRRYRFTQCI